MLPTDADGHRRRRLADHHHHGPGPGARPARRSASALAGLPVRGATLEDVFLKLTGREYRA